MKENIAEVAEGEAAANSGCLARKEYENRFQSKGAAERIQAAMREAQGRAQPNKRKLQKRSKLRYEEKKQDRV